MKRTTLHKFPRRNQCSAQFNLEQHCALVSLMLAILLTFPKVWSTPEAETSSQIRVKSPGRFRSAS